MKSQEIVRSLFRAVLPTALALTALAGCSSHESNSIVNTCNKEKAVKTIEQHIRNGKKLRARYLLPIVGDTVEVVPKSEPDTGFMSNPIVLKCGERILAYVGVSDPSATERKNPVFKPLSLRAPEDSRIQVFDGNHELIPGEAEVVEGTIIFPHPYPHNAVVCFTDGPHAIGCMP